MQLRWRYIAAGSLGLLVDQLAKWAVFTVLPPSGTTKSWGMGFGLTAYLNRQFAWSWPLSNTVVIILTVTLLIVGGWFYFRYWRTRPGLLPIFLIASGAVSNLIDRLWRGGVVDYFLVPGGGMINLADVLIFVGIGLLIISSRNENS